LSPLEFEQGPHAGGSGASQSSAFVRRTAYDVVDFSTGVGFTGCGKTRGFEGYGRQAVRKMIEK
jgi:hypothetical protein